MGFVAPQPEETRPRPPAGSWIDAPPDAGFPLGRSEVDLTALAAEQQGVTDFERTLQPEQPGVPPDQPVVEDPVYDVFDAPVLQPANAGGRTLGGGGPTIVPTGHPGDNSSSSNTEFETDPDNQANTPDSFPDSLEDSLTAPTNDPGVGDGTGLTAEERRRLGLPDRRRALSPQEIQKLEDSAKASAQNFFNQNVRPEDLEGISAQGGLPNFELVKQELDNLWTEKDKADALADLSNAIETGEIDVWDATAFVNDGKEYEGAYDEERDVWFIRPVGEDGEWETWDGEDAPGNIDDIIDPETGEVRDDFIRKTASGIRTNDAAIIRMLEMAGNPSADKLKAWAERMDKGHDSSERATGSEEWWYGILAKELGYTEIFHRPYSLPDEEQWAEVTGLETDIDDWQQYLR